ncbi:MAG: hypothetical protein ACE5JO_08040 [Candidatus Binatia bacterium]
MLLKTAICLMSLGFSFTQGAASVNETLDRVIFRLEEFERRNSGPATEVLRGSSAVKHGALCQAKVTHFANREDLAQLVPDLLWRKVLTEGEEKLVSKLVSGYLTFGQIIKRMLANDAANPGDKSLSLHLARLSQYQGARRYTGLELLNVFRDYFGGLESVLSNAGLAGTHLRESCIDPAEYAESSSE